ncbi:MAG: cation transporter [Cytophagales bacterium]|nr:cation transporter [Armatimonadota bacterium]
MGSRRRAESVATTVALGGEKIAAARLSVLSNCLLVALKLGVGLFIGSVAVLSEAVHSATDLIAALIAFFAVRASTAPPDEAHPYGHGKVESLSSMAEALLIVGAGAYIVVEAFLALRYDRAAPALGWGIAVMALSAVVNMVVSRRLFVVARLADSAALEADAHHLAIDIWTSVGVVAGLALVALTGWRWIDPVVGILVAVFIFVTGWRIARGALVPLLDTRLPESELQTITGVLDGDTRILSWHKLRTRKAGPQRHIDVHIQVDDALSLRDAHSLTEELEDQMRDVLPNVEVMIHTEPYEEEMRHHEENPHV